MQLRNRSVMEPLRLLAALAVLAHVRPSAAARTVLQQTPSTPPPPYALGLFTSPSPPPPPPPGCPPQTQQPSTLYAACDPHCGCTGLLECHAVINLGNVCDCQEPLPRGPYEVCNYDCGGCGDDDESYYPDCVPILGNIGRCTMGIRPPPRPPGCLPVIDEPVKLGAHCDPSCGCGALLVCNASNACDCPDPDDRPYNAIETCNANCGCNPRSPFGRDCYPIEPTGTIGYCICFPANATVTVIKAGVPSSLSIAQLIVGDMVMVALANGTLAFSPVVNIPHSERHRINPFIKLQTTTASLTLSAEHYAYVGRKTGGPFEARLATAGRHVKVGDVLWVAAADGHGLVQDTVVAVEAVQAEGMFNPYTNEGSIVVDGVAASVYIDFLGSEAAAHRSAAKYRLLARAAPRLVRWLHARGLNQPLLLFMARALPEIARKSTIGPWPLRPFWRAAYWALTELPARLEDILPTAPTVPLTALKSLPEERSDGGAICASPADAAANRTAHAAGIPVKASTSAAEGACAALGDGFAAS